MCDLNNMKTSSVRTRVIILLAKYVNLPVIIYSSMERGYAYVRLLYY
jgi:hypothetical protein